MAKEQDRRRMVFQASQLRFRLSTGAGTNLALGQIDRWQQSFLKNTAVVKLLQMKPSARGRGDENQGNFIARLLGLACNPQLIQQLQFVRRAANVINHPTAK